MSMKRWIVCFFIEFTLSVQLNAKFSVPLVRHDIYGIRRPLNFGVTPAPFNRKYLNGHAHLAYTGSSIGEKINNYVRETIDIYVDALIKEYIRGRTKRFVDRVKEPIKNFIAKFYNIYKTLCDNRRQSLESKLPLRHRRWTVKFERPIKYLTRVTDSDVIEFLDDGTVVASSGIKGKWWTDFGDLIWKLPLDGDRSMYFSCQLCWNNFAKSAFMRRGVVFMDREYGKWMPIYLFRPVICKFVAHGIEEANTIKR